MCSAQEKPQFNTASARVRAADVESAIGLLCSQKNMARNKDGRVTGCRVCPAGTAFAEMNDSHLDIDAEMPGHLTSARADNLILDADGCEPHSNNYGGSYVFAIEGGKARLMRYNAGLITDQCHKFAYADGRDYLICRSGWGGQGEADEFVSMVTFAGMGKGTETILLSVRDTTGECQGALIEVARKSEIKNTRFTPADAAQITGLTIEATLGSVSCASFDEEGKLKPGVKQPVVKSYDVEFAFDGKQFKVTPASRAALNKLTPGD